MQDESKYLQGWNYWTVLFSLDKWHSSKGSVCWNQFCGAQRKVQTVNRRCICQALYWLPSLAPEYFFLDVFVCRFSCSKSFIIRKEGITRSCFSKASQWSLLKKEKETHTLLENPVTHKSLEKLEISQKASLTLALPQRDVFFCK